MLRIFDGRLYGNVVGIRIRRVGQYDGIARARRAVIDTNRKTLSERVRDIEVDAVVGQFEVGSREAIIGLRCVALVAASVIGLPDEVFDGLIECHRFSASGFRVDVGRKLNEVARLHADVLKLLLHILAVHRSDGDKVGQCGGCGTEQRNGCSESYTPRPGERVGFHNEISFM